MGLTIGTIVGGTKALVGIVTLNPALIINGGAQVVRSQVISTVVDDVTDGDGILDTLSDLFS